MRGKLIVAAVGIFGYGVYVGWAFTADRYERKLKAKNVYLQALREARLDYTRLPVVDDDENLPTMAEAIAEIYPDVDVNQPELPFNELDQDIRVEFQSENAPEGKTDDDGVTGEDQEVDEVKLEETRRGLQSLIDNYTANQEEVDSFSHMGQTLIQDNTPPFVIPRDKYAYDEDEGEYYDKITVTYYVNHRIVLDEDDEVLEDVGNVLGWRNLAQFGGESGDADVVFVRNRRLLTDYEVVRDDESPLPLHVKYGMGKEEFEVNKAAGFLRLRKEDL
jgi:hypothetical protein